MKGGLKSPAVVMLETTPYLTQRKNFRLERIKINQTKKGGYQRQNRGTNRGTFCNLLTKNLASMRVSSHL